MIAVDEQAAEASAATATSAGNANGHSEPLRLVFDHPFAFLIYDQVTGAILFAGNIADPTLP